jgi:hypothetical protein
MVLDSYSEDYRHRVGRVLSVSPVVGIGTPPPFGPAVRGGGHTRLRLKGWGSPNSNEGTYTVVLYIYKYFVTIDLPLVSIFPIRGHFSLTTPIDADRDPCEC